MSKVTTEKLLEDCKILISDAEELIRATADNVGEQVAEMRQRLVERVEKGKVALARRRDELREQAEQAKSHAVSLSQDEDWRRVALAAGLGVLVGMALRSRRRKPTRPDQ